MFKIGYMEYANVYPIFHYLLRDSSLEFKRGFPSDLNKAMRAGEIDVSPSSSIEYARNPELYKVISGLSVSSVGQVKSVIVFSRFKAKELDGKKIYFTRESNTSTVLCRIVLEKFYGISPIYTDIKDEADAELLIGDKALYAYYNHNSRYMIDLGAEWYSFTGLPFVFALWIAGKKASGLPEFTDFAERLRKCAADSAGGRAGLVDKYLSIGYTAERMLDYWDTIDYRLTDSHIKGLRLFYEKAFEIGETPYNPEICFL